MVAVVVEVAVAVMVEVYTVVVVAVAVAVVVHGSGGDSGSLQTRESTSEPFTPVYSRVTTPTLELSPDAMIPISPGSPMIFNSQDQDFILQNFGTSKPCILSYSWQVP